MGNENRKTKQLTCMYVCMYVRMATLKAPQTLQRVITLLFIGRMAVRATMPFIIFTLKFAFCFLYIL